MSASSARALCSGGAAAPVIDWLPMPYAKNGPPRCRERAHLRIIIELFHVPRSIDPFANIPQYPRPPIGRNLCYQAARRLLIIDVICKAYGLSSEGDGLDRRSGSARSETHDEVYRPRAPTVQSGFFQSIDQREACRRYADADCRCGAGGAVGAVDLPQPYPA